MPGENLAEAHLAQMRALSGVPVEPRADAAPAVRRDNATSGSEPVIGSGTAAEIEQVLNDSKRR